jgi:nicotinamide-nucleotide amidase
MSTLEEKILEAARALGEAAKERRHVCVTAESCTGGGIAAAITAIPGSSEWFDQGFVTYAVPAKTELLGVDPELISKEGVVSEAVAQAMARGALARSPRATLAVAVTGVAGPGGGSEETPVGTVCIGWAERFNEHIVTSVRTIHVPGSRRTVREATVLTALRGLTELMRFANPASMPCEY